MSNYGWTNEAGEPIMDGAAYRFEQALDEQYAYERMDDDYTAPYDEPDVWCDRCGEDHDTEDHEDEPSETDDTPFLTEDYDFHNEQSVMEDQWLDGSWEE